MLLDQLRARLAEKNQVASVFACSMERRRAVRKCHMVHFSENSDSIVAVVADYEFNEPMLEDIFAQPEVCNVIKRCCLFAVCFTTGLHHGSPRQLLTHILPDR